jgi:aminoglycoside phosphotransferase (APT) family kinase protein
LKRKCEYISVTDCYDNDAQSVAVKILNEKYGSRLSDIKTDIDTEYNKTYAVFLVLDDDDRKYVLKKARIVPELYSYLSVFRTGDPVPKIFYHEKIDSSSCWLFLEHTGNSDLRSFGLSAHELAAEALAVFHSNHQVNDKPELPELYSLKRCIDKNSKFLYQYAHENDTPDVKELLKISNKIFKMFSNQATTVIHGDLLSMNILYNGADATLIDWSACEKGCYAQDLGRWLGDIRHASSDGWIDKAWEQPILLAYYRKRSELNGGNWKKWNEFEMEYQYSKKLNYLTIVLSHLRNKWEKSEWYSANLSALFSNGM